MKLEIIKRIIQLAAVVFYAVNLVAACFAEKEKKTHHLLWAIFFYLMSR